MRKNVKFKILSLMGFELNINISIIKIKILIEILSVL